MTLSIRQFSMWSCTYGLNIYKIKNAIHKVGTVCLHFETLWCCSLHSVSKAHWSTYWLHVAAPLNTKGNHSCLWPPDCVTPDSGNSKWNNAPFELPRQKGLDTLENSRMLSWLLQVELEAAHCAALVTSVLCFCSHDLISATQSKIYSQWLGRLQTCTYFLKVTLNLWIWWVETGSVSFTLPSSRV